MPPGRRPSNGPIRHQNPSYKFEEFPNVPYDGPIPVDPNPTWPMETVEWWSAVSKMPHCAAWAPTDWVYAKESGNLHALWTEQRKVGQLTELRYREAKMGTTYDARLQIRVRWVDPETADADATVSPIRKIG